MRRRRRSRRATLRALLASVGLVAGLAGCGRIAFDSPPPEPDADVPGSCSSGEMLTPATFNASPVDQDDACNLSNALGRDGLLAGLDLIGPTATHCESFDGSTAEGCGCLGLDLHAAFPVGRVHVFAAAVTAACGSPCTTQCGTGHTFGVWSGVAVGAYTHVTTVALTSTAITDYPVDIQATARYLLVCRDAWSAERDDVAVDDITIACQ